MSTSPTLPVAPKQQRRWPRQVAVGAVEQRVGTGPDTGDLDQQIGRARGERHAAADAEEYEQAASLRDRGKELLAEKASRHQKWAAAHPDLPPVAENLR